MSDKEFHRVANQLPLMEGQDFDDLVADIKKNGLNEPIWLYEGQILDGRNRYRACLAATVAPRYREWEGRDPIAFVWSQNVERRQLVSGQRAILAVRMEKLRETLNQEAQSRMLAGAKAGGKAGGKGRPKSSENSPPQKIAEGYGSREAPPPAAPPAPVAMSSESDGHDAEAGAHVIERAEVRDQLAAMAGTNHTYIALAQRMEKEEPAIADAVVAGTITMAKAQRIMREPKEKWSEALRRAIDQHNREKEGKTTETKRTKPTYRATKDRDVVLRNEVHQHLERLGRARWEIVLDMLGFADGERVSLKRLLSMVADEIERKADEKRKK